MPRTPEQFEQIRTESREKILTSALELFAERGFSTTSVRSLAERAGVSLGLLYNYFDGKLDLLRAILARGSEEVDETFAAAEAAPPSESLTVLVRAAFETVRQNRQFWKLSYQLRMQADVGPEIAARGAAIRNRIEELLAQSGARDARLRAALLFAAIDGVAQHYVLDPEHYPLDAVAEDLILLLAPSAGLPVEAP